MKTKNDSKAIIALCIVMFAFGIDLLRFGQVALFLIFTEIVILEMMLAIIAMTTFGMW